MTTNHQATIIRIRSTMSFSNGQQGLILELAFAYLDVRALEKIKQVCHQWKRLSAESIQATYSSTIEKQQAFQTREELRTAVRYFQKKDFTELVARRYGWPIGKWDVSNLRDLSYVFTDLSLIHI